MVTPLFLLRHGPTEASGRAPLGRRDLPVTAEGERLWPSLRADLLRLGIRQILSSPLQRARRHAEDLGLPCTLVLDLAEQDWGAWDGVPWDLIGPAESFFADPVHQAPPEGESFAACAARAVACVEAHLVQDTPTLVFAHAGVLRGLLAHYTGLPLLRSLDLGWEPFGLSRIDVYAPHQGALRYHNRIPTDALSG